MTALNALVSESIDVVVHLDRTGDGIEVTSIVAVEDLAGPAAGTAFTTTEVFARTGPAGPAAWTGEIPTRLGSALEREGIQISELCGRVG